MPPELHAVKVPFYAKSVDVVTSGHMTKVGGQTIRAATTENPQLYANCTALSFTEPELLPIEVLHCGNREFHVFLRKIVENVKIFCLHLEKYVDFTESCLLSHKPRKSVIQCDLCRCAKKEKSNGGKKIDTDDDNFTYVHPRPP